MHETYILWPSLLDHRERARVGVGGMAIQTKIAPPTAFGVEGVLLSGFKACDLLRIGGWDVSGLSLVSTMRLAPAASEVALPLAIFHRRVRAVIVGAAGALGDARRGNLADDRLGGAGV